MPVNYRVLIVAGNDAMVRLTAALLPDGCEADVALGAERAFELLASRTHDVLVATGNCPEGLAIARRASSVSPSTRSVLICESAAREDVVEAMRAHVFALLTDLEAAEAIGDWIENAVDVKQWEDGIEVLAAGPAEVRVRARCTLLTAERLLLFFDEMKKGMPPGPRQDLAVAFREILLNAIEHGGQLDESQHVEILCARGEDRILYSIRDPGRGFSFASLAHSAISNPAEDPRRHERVRVERGLRAGGLGLLLADKMVDELTYNEAGNEVTLVKYLDGRCGS